MLESDDIILYSAISRIWSGDYVRISGYKRELSYWLSEIFANKLSKKKLSRYKNTSPATQCPILQSQKK